MERRDVAAAVALLLRHLSPQQKSAAVEEKIAIPLLLRRSSTVAAKVVLGYIYPSYIAALFYCGALGTVEEECRNLSAFATVIFENVLNLSSFINLLNSTNAICL